MEGAAAGDRVGARGGGAAAGEGAAGLPEEGEGSGAPLSGDAWLENQTQRVFSGIAELAGGAATGQARGMQEDASATHGGSRGRVDVAALSERSHSGDGSPLIQQRACIVQAPMKAPRGPLLPRCVHIVLETLADPG